MTKSNLESKISDLHDEIQSKDKEIAKLNKKIDDIRQEHQRRSIFNDKASFATTKRGSSLNQKLKKI